MSKTTIIRKIDELGRIVLPKDIRKTLNIHTGDLLELQTNQNILSITKYSSIQEIAYLLEILLNTFYLEYHIDGLLLAEEKIVKISSYSSIPKIEKKLKEAESIRVPIQRDGKQIAEFILFTTETKYQEILKFLSLFLNKYLEEC